MTTTRKIPLAVAAALALAAGTALAGGEAATDRPDTAAHEAKTPAEQQAPQAPKQESSWLRKLERFLDAVAPRQQGARTDLDECAKAQAAGYPVGCGTAY